jgi:hypothetical protein
LKSVEKKSTVLSEASKRFEKQSHDLERIMYWRKMKLNIIICLVVLAVLAYILIPIIIA